jgi:integrase
MATFEKRIGSSGKTTWRVRVRRQSGPWLTKSFPKKSTAEEWARNIEHKLDVGDHVPTSEARRYTLGDAIDRYLKAILPHASRRKNAREQTRLLEWWRAELGPRSLQTISSSDVAAARDRLATKNSRSGKPLAGGTVNRHLAALSGVLKIAVTEFGWISKNPASKINKLAESKGRERFLNERERAALLEECRASSCAALLPIVQFALATGARKGEILALQWAGVDLERRTAHFLDTKNGESRTVPLAPVAVTVLQTWRKGRLPVGNVFAENQSTLDNAWQAAPDAAGLPDVRFHDLRHSAASYLAMSGASLMDIAAILGHKTLAMVKRYAHLSEQHTTAAIDRMAEKFLR